MSNKEKKKVISVDDDDENRGKEKNEDGFEKLKWLELKTERCGWITFAMKVNFGAYRT
jgi:hypothetical protein